VRSRSMTSYLKLQIKSAWTKSETVNALRRWENFYLLKSMTFEEPLRLHLGCGRRHLDGYVNIDHLKTDATDKVLDIRRLPFKDNSVEIIETYHVIEHLPRHDLPKVLKEWRRILAPGGKLVIECPNLDESVKEYLQGNDERLDNIFGKQRFPGDIHLFGYNFRRLRELLEVCEYRDIKECLPKDYHVQQEPCLRVECIK